MIRGSIALGGNPERTVDLLQATSPYELESMEVVQISTVYPVYLLRTRSASLGRHDTASPGNAGAFSHNTALRGGRAECDLPNLRRILVRQCWLLTPQGDHGIDP